MEIFDQPAQNINVGTNNSVKNKPPPKKSRKSYSFVEKADFIDKFLHEQSYDHGLSQNVFAESIGVDKSMLSR